MASEGYARSECSFHILGENVSSKNANLLVSQIEQGIKTKKVIDTMEKSVNIITGVPKTVKKISVDPTRVYRQYVNTGIDDIIKHTILLAGNLPYVIAGGGGSREFYESLTGVFLTDPEVSPSEVGLPSSDHYDYVDFTLHSNTGLLQIEEKILLIPGAPDHPQWLVEKFKQWSEGKYEASSSELDIFEKMKSTQIEKIAIPIRVVQYRKNGILYKPKD